MSSKLGVIILAAGQGKRMHSPLPKVCHEVLGRPMILHVLDRVKTAMPEASVCVVVGHAKEQVQALIEDSKISFAVQEKQLGTGHAVQAALDSAWGQSKLSSFKSILVLSGDTPLILEEALLALTEKPFAQGVAMRMLTTEVADPYGYGRIVRKGASVQKIVEHKDASAKELKIHEINPAVYLFETKFLTSEVKNLGNKNAQGEYYLTDLVGTATKKKKKVDAVFWSYAQDLMGVNNLWELAQAQKYLSMTINCDWAMQGVSFADPERTWVESTVKLSPGVKLDPNVVIKGNSVIEEGAYLKAGTYVQDSHVGKGAQVGPYAHLRPGSEIGAETKIGNFVEIKKSKIGNKTSIAHLSYVGDAEVGSRVNIGCGFVTCNYDGVNKHKTVIEDDVFMGSDCQVIAPLKVSRGAYIASGSTLTEDVPADSLAIARSRQVNKPGYAKKYKRGSK